MIFLPEECQSSHLYRVSAVRIGGLWPEGGKISSVSTTEQNKTGPNRETTTTRSIAVAIIAALGGLLFGYDTGVISGALLYIQRSFELTPGQESTVTAMLLVGAAIGAFLGGRVADSLGRRGTILLGAVGFIIGSIWCAFATSAFSLGTARTLLGVCIGGVSIVVPMYISEMAPPHVRGRLVSLNSLMIVIGQLVAFLTNSALASSGNWRLMLGLGAVPGIVLLIGMLVLPDTPAYLVRRGQEGKALAVLRQIQGDEATLAEVAVGEASSSADQRAAERLAVKTPWVRRTVIIAMLIGVTQQVTGANAIMYFAPTMMNKVGLSTESSVYTSIIIGIASVISCAIGMSIIDRVGRRRMLIIGLVGCASSLLVLAPVYGLSSNSSTGAMMSLLLMTVFIVFQQAAVSVATWLLISEIIPTEARGLGMGLAGLALWVANWFVAQAFLPMVDAVGGAWSFFFFAITGAIALVFTIKAVPETSGKTLAEVREYMIAAAK
ncbi:MULTISPECIES: sugar porter family MFS transporter [Corynebacterium]|uniref:Sugar porter family MFS transporter n=1 Tax=Corynebacterium amycolatum TaxID=43765 RepID=A0AB38XXV9_CORAY|nr:MULTISPECIES: sugar porter family MFS transporter [Corynebacterium]AIN82371.1 putative metabolite transport protein CsbC [Corynebacterium sp. ATCC 6931]MBC6726438.1 MFS transporter [Corynebacterium amycolatum]MCT1718260.1 sugar porter family MFS transporter [Corynebacterium amycolatum]MDY7341450.1 sugar porter family MFS transporter [Corynebacterium amycolatum]QRP16623.1 sugar porter family MFS transporter [Corynebacterium amycolatum]